MQTKCVGGPLFEDGTYAADAVGVIDEHRRALHCSTKISPPKSKERWDAHAPTFISPLPEMRAAHPRKAYIVGGHITKFVGKGHPDFIHKKHPDFGKRTNPELKDYIFESVQVQAS